MQNRHPIAYFSKALSERNLTKGLSMAQLRGRRGVVGVQFAHSRGLSGLLSCLTMCQFFRGLGLFVVWVVSKVFKGKSVTRDVFMSVRRGISFF